MWNATALAFEATAGTRWYAFRCSAPSTTGWMPPLSTRRRLPWPFRCSSASASSASTSPRNRWLTSRLRCQGSWYSRRPAKCSSRSRGAPESSIWSKIVRPSRLTAIPDELHPDVADALRARGMDSLWAHQSEALFAGWAGPTIVTTGTASGKSLCFNLPTLDVLCRDARARALYLYPTKALAQDQARALNALGVARARPAIYDGDTPREQRSAIRRRANVVLTNPDMLHLGVLPNHPALADFFSNLAVIVVDEAHVYRGVFGSHVANVLRRLRRIAEVYGTSPRFLLASATIANPAELAERLTGLEDFTVIGRDGSRGGRRTIAMWTPPLVDQATAARRSALAEAADLLAELVLQG